MTEIKSNYLEAELCGQRYFSHDRMKPRAGYILMEVCEQISRCIQKQTDRSSRRPEEYLQHGPERKLREMLAGKRLGIVSYFFLHKPLHVEGNRTVYVFIVSKQNYVKGLLDIINVSSYKEQPQVPVDWLTLRPERVSCSTRETYSKCFFSLLSYHYPLQNKPKCLQRRIHF